MKKTKILIIDDDVDFAEMVKLNLEEECPYQVLVENDGSRAYEAVRTIKPDFIFLDVMMRNMNGRDIWKQIKADIDLRGIPIVYLTAMFSNDPVKEEAKALGDASPALSKPILLQDLIHCIEQYTSKS